MLYFIGRQSIFAVAALLLTFSGSALAATGLKLTLTITFPKTTESATGSLTLQSAKSGATIKKTWPIRPDEDEAELDIIFPTAPEDDELVFASGMVVSGKVVAGRQSVIGWLPVTKLQFDETERAKWAERTVQVFATQEEAYEHSFPLSNGVEASLKAYSVENVLTAVKIMFLSDLVSTETQWEKITSSLMTYLLPYLAKQLPVIEASLNHLEEYVRIANNSQYNRFYVEFLMELKKKDIGGVPLPASQVYLRDALSNSLIRMHTEHLTDTFDLVPNTIRIFVAGMSTDHPDCLGLSTTLLNAIDGFIKSGSVPRSNETFIVANTVSALSFSSLCAQKYYTLVGPEDAQTPDIIGGAAFLASDDAGLSFMDRYVSLVDTMNERHLFSVDDLAPLVRRRIAEITDKYYQQYIRIFPKDYKPKRSDI